MAKYQNKKETEKIGKQITELRTAKFLSLEEVAYMTGFASSTIKAVEKGSNTDLSHIIEIAKAIGVHPMEIFNVKFELTPRHKPSPDRKNKILLTSRIAKLVSESDFFKSPKFVKNVISYLKEESNLEVDSTHVSVILKRLSSEGKLKYAKVGRDNLYTKKGK